MTSRSVASLYVSGRRAVRSRPLGHSGLQLCETRPVLRLGGLFLGFAEVMSVAYLSSDFRDAVAFGLLFVILLVRPSGMFGKVLERKA